MATDFKRTGHQMVKQMSKDDLIAKLKIVLTFLFFRAAEHNVLVVNLELKLIFPIIESIT